MSTEHPARQAGQDVMSEAEIQKADACIQATFLARDFRHVERAALARLVAAARKAGELQAVVKEMLEQIASSRMCSIGSINNTYECQISVEAVKRWAAALAPSTSETPAEQRTDAIGE